MNLKVNISKTAEKNLDSVLKFIEARWSKKIERNFLIEISKSNFNNNYESRNFSQIICK